MPYIKEKDREEAIHNLALGVMPRDPGTLNYVLTRLIHNYIAQKDVSYSVLNEVIGVLECCKQELYRRVVSPYEDQKILENGDL